MSYYDDQQYSYYGNNGGSSSSANQLLYSRAVVGSSNSLPSNYDAAMVLYLNPELTAYSNVRAVEDIRDRYEEFSSLPSTIPPLPETFDDQVYLADNREVLDFSQLNRTIMHAMSNEGIDKNTIERNSMFLGTILRDVSLVAPNTFEFDSIDELGLFRLNNKTLQLGDDVRLTRPVGTDHIYGRVVAMDPFSYRFTISNASYDVHPIDGQSSNYTFYGIRLYDHERLARVNLARRYYEDASNQNLLVLSRNFNKEFHQILYPNTRLLTQSETYVDFINRWGLKDYRLATASDLYNASAPLTTILNLQVRCNMTLGKLVRWKGFTICNFSSNDWDVSDDATDGTIPTDRAIKTYVDRPYRTYATFNRFLACNDAIFSRNVSMASNIYVRLDSTAMHCDVTMRSNLGVEQNVAVGGYINCATTTQTMQLLAISRIGIGSDGASVVYDDYGYVPAPPPGGGGGTSTIPTYSNNTSGGGTSTGGGTSGATYCNNSLFIQDKISFAAGSYTMQVSEFDSALRLYPLGAGSNSYSVFDYSGNLGLGLPSSTMSVNYKLYVGGDVYSTGVVITQSDERKKTSIQQLDDKMALDKMLQLRGCTYEMKAERDSNNAGHRRHVGLIAQDVLEALPEAVYTDADGYHSIAYGNLMGLAVEAMRDLDRRMKSVEAELSDLRQSKKTTGSNELGGLVSVNCK
jgi:Chaperone of endosialidase